VWSGTSFAAPVLAGEVAHELAKAYRSGERDLSTGAAVARLRRILDNLKGRQP
jgi:hypothetical protein